MDSQFVMVLLKSGEVIFGKVVGESDKFYIINKPHSTGIQPAPDGSGRMSLKFLPYPFPMRDLFIINDVDDENIDKSDVLKMYMEDKIKKEIIDGYISVTSRIEIAPSMPSGKSLIKL